MLQGQLSFFSTEHDYVATPVKMIEIQEVMKIRSKILAELDYKLKISLDDFRDQKKKNIQDC